MNFVELVMVIFISLESSSVMTLYFDPGSLRGNGVGVFKAWDKCNDNPEIADFAKYLVNWVAGTKLIFIALIIVILVFGNTTLQVYSLIALVLSILTFYWRLYPMIKKMDTNGLIKPKGYSQTLAYMIASFVTIFLLVFHLEGLTMIKG